MSDRALKPDTIVNGRYKIDRVLGEGGFGITYLVHDIEDNKAYALKEYFPLQTAFRNVDTGEVCTYEENVNKGIKRFEEEAEILKEFRHLDGIVHVRDYFSFNKTVYIVMEFIDGITLKEYVSLYGGFEYDELMEMLSPIMKSLVILHRHSLIHRDISPDNIMLGMDNKLYLIDFGAAKEVEEGKTTTVMLKAGYAPPEQYLNDGKMGAWTDVYGMCGTIYTALGGGVPTDAVARLQGKILIPLSERGVRLETSQWRAIEKGMSVRSAERYRDMEELLDALTVPPTDEDIVTVYGNDNCEIRSLVENASSVVKREGKGRLNRATVFVAVFAVLAVIVGVIYGISNTDRTAKDTSADDSIVSKEVSETSKSKLCEMPDVVGMTNLEAYRKIREADDKIHIETTRQYSDEVGLGLVISQNVEANTRYNEGAITDIVLTVSMGREDVDDSSTGEASSDRNAGDVVTGETGMGETGGSSNNNNSSSTANSSQNFVTNDKTGSSQTSGSGNTNNSSKNSTGSKSNNKKSSGKDFDVKSDGNEQVDFYLD